MLLKLFTWRVERKYLDYAFKIVLVPIAAHFLVSIRETDTFIERISTLSYWVAFSYSAVVAYIVVCLIANTSLKYDIEDSWEIDFSKRLSKQLINCLILPLAGIMISATIYFACFHKNILHRGYMNKELPLTVIFLVLTNSFYFALYIKFNLIAKYNTLVDTNNILLDTNIILLDTNIILTENNQLKIEGEKWSSIKILGDFRGTSKIIDLQNIVLVNYDNKVNTVFTSDGEKTIVTYSLLELEAILLRKPFMKINRSQIINLDEVIYFKRKKSGILVTFSVVVKEEVLVSKRLTSTFIQFYKLSKNYKEE